MTSGGVQSEWAYLRRVPRQKRARDRVESILDAAAALVEVKAIVDIGTEDIAEHAGVPIGSVYHYFEDKLSIFAELLRRMMARADVSIIGGIVDGYDITDVAELVDRVVDIEFEAYRRQPAYGHLLRQFRPTAEFTKMADDAAKRVAAAIASHPDFVRRAPRGRGVVIARTVVEVAKTMQRLAFVAEEPNEAVDYMREAKVLLAAYLQSTLGEE